MKWMGGWSWEDYCLAPTELTDRIIDLMNEETAEYEEKVKNL